MASQPRPNTFTNAPVYMANGNSSGPTPGAQALLPNNGRLIETGGKRVLCIADVRGNLRSLNDLARQARADHIIHTGDFGFYDDSSLERIADKTLKHVAQYSPLLPDPVKRSIAQTPPQTSIKQRFPADQLPLSELPLLLSKQINLDVPVYTVWGACEDVRVLEKFRSGEYKVDKLHIIDEANSRLLDIGGVKLRLLGLGGAVVMHKLFDNGEGKTTIAGGQGTMWTTLLQMGELVDTANRVYDPTETRVFVTHASPAREGMLNQLSVTLKADFSISAGLHFRYGSSYNEFSVNPTLDHYRGKLAASKASFNDVWETVKTEVESAVDQNSAQKTLLDNALDIVSKMPSGANGGNPFGGPVVGAGAGGQVDESAFKNMWNFNLADAAFGYLVLEIEGGRIGTEMRAQGFNFAHRGGKPSSTAQSATSGLSNAVSAQAPTGPAQQNRPSNAAPAQGQSQGSRHVPQPGPPPYAQAASKAPVASAVAGQPASAPAPAAAPVTTTTQAKPATPQPTGTNVNLPTPAEHHPAPPSSGDVRNGTGEKATESVAEITSPTEKKLSTGLFISNVDTIEQVRGIFPEEAQSKILTVEKFGKFNFAVKFANHEDAKATLDSLPMENKRPSPHGQKKPYVKFLEDRSSQYRQNQGNQGAGTWQGSNRGGATTAPRGGYQSGGASDSEGGRVLRYRGGRGQGRGSDRGGRGGRGGRGSYGKPGDTSSSPAPTTPASTTDNKPAAGGDA